LPPSSLHELSFGFGQVGPAALGMPHAQASSSSQAIADATSSLLFPEFTLQEQPSLPNVHLQRIGYSMRHEAPVNNNYSNLHKPVSLPPPPFPTSQDVNAHHGQHGQDSSSVSHHRGYTSTTPLGRGQEEVKSKLARPRPAKNRDRVIRQLRFIEYRPDAQTKSPVVPLQPFVDFTTLEQIFATSQGSMMASIFNIGFFPPPAMLDRMANDALDAAISTYPDGTSLFHMLR
jgi:hypothetical protein